jgi:hypothetical protein
VGAEEGAVKKIIGCLALLLSPLAVLAASPYAARINGGEWLDLVGPPVIDWLPGENGYTMQLDLQTVEPVCPDVAECAMDFDAPQSITCYDADPVVCELGDLEGS